MLSRIEQYLRKIARGEGAVPPISVSDGSKLLQVVNNTAKWDKINIPSNSSIGGNSNFSFGNKAVDIKGGHGKVNLSSEFEQGKEITTGCWGSNSDDMVFLSILVGFSEYAMIYGLGEHTVGTDTLKVELVNPSEGATSTYKLKITTTKTSGTLYYTMIVGKATLRF